MKIAGRILILVTLFGPAGCRMGAPCAGFGCPAFAPKSSAQLLQQAPAQTAQNRKISKRNARVASNASTESAAKAGQ